MSSVLNRTRPSNTKIQRTGAVTPNQQADLLPAADLERSAARRSCVTCHVGLAKARAAWEELKNYSVQLQPEEHPMHRIEYVHWQEDDSWLGPWLT
jgi:hypothetical protein